MITSLMVFQVVGVLHVLYTYCMYQYRKCKCINVTTKEHPLIALPVIVLLALSTTSERGKAKGGVNSQDARNRQQRPSQPSILSRMNHTLRLYHVLCSIPTVSVIQPRQSTEIERWMD